MSMEPTQHLDDIVIPDIEITAGWPVSDVETIEDCDDAFAYLSAAVARIDYQIEMNLLLPLAQQDAAWAARARYALKYKKAALGIVANKRAAINKAEKQRAQRDRDRALLEFIKGEVAHGQFMEWVAKSGVDRTSEPEQAAA